jgi:multiple sugar transport system ATP-binding protein
MTARAEQRPAIVNEPERVGGISCRGLTKVYGDGTKAVAALDLEIKAGTLLALVGPSGCGKTTLLRMIAGLEAITQGTLAIDSRVVNQLPPKERDIAMVFQNYALYPHMTAFENIAFGLRVRHERRAAIRAKVLPIASLLGLSAALKKKPGQMSGGQRQRVAMGRAIVREPKIFLMDEPLSNLDAQLRIQMRTEIARLQRRLGVTTIYVTHDQTEAMVLGDHVAVMKDGVLQQHATPQELYSRPRNAFVARFIGAPSMNIFETTVRNEPERTIVEFGATQLIFPRRSNESPPPPSGPHNVLFGIRPEALEEVTSGQEDRSRPTISGVIELRENLGPEVFVHIASPGAPKTLGGYVDDPSAAEDAPPDVGPDAMIGSSGLITARLGARSTVREGAPITLAVDAAGVHFFDVASGDRVAFWDEEPID